MTQWLSDLGRLCAHRARTVLLGWLITLLALAVLIVWTGPHLSNNFTIPGTQAQEGLDVLAQRFPEMNGTSGHILLTATNGPAIETYRGDIRLYLQSIAPTLPAGTELTDPWSEYLRTPSISPDGRHALINIQFPFTIDSIDQTAKTLLEEAATRAPSGLTAQPGGQIYQTTTVPLSVMELIGVGIAFIALMVTLRRFLAALTPLVSALLGTAGIVTLIVLAALWLDISTTTPTLAVMITLAVGIDYALFIVTRHQRQMRAGMDCYLSISLATATAGSAVIYAAMTVIIALCALAVTGIPFLTIMGLSAAGGVTIAAISSTTALPALLALLQHRVLPTQKRKKTSAEENTEESATPDDGIAFNPGHNTVNEPAQRTLPERWAEGVTAHPMLALIGVLTIVLGLASPAPLLALSLPDNGVEPPGTYARDTYDAVNEAFGPGANAPLLIVGDIIHSTDPLGLMDNWARSVEKLPGVASIQLATPNRNADLGVLVIIPTTSSTDPATAHTVKELRALAPQWQTRFGIDNIRVTGLTAAKIDITDRLTDALIPFGIVVVTLALVILTLVFHSIWVPLSAALGYLLSVGAAFGVTAAVFTWQPLNNALLIGQTGAIICFMPIIVIGVLFGLAMDYQVFVVTAIQEATHRGADTRQSIIRGMRNSGSVVTAAALIMVAVFVGFIPHGSYYVQPIAVGLAAGVAVDAFLIRMTAIPAFLMLIGKYAWWCPTFLANRLPHLSHTEDALTSELSTPLHAGAPTPLLISRSLTVDGRGHTTSRLADFDIYAGECVRFDASPLVARQVMRILAGVSRPRRGYLLMNLANPRVQSHSPKRARAGFIYDSVSADLVVKDIQKSNALPCLAVDIPLNDEELRALYAASAGAGGCLLLGPLVDIPPDLSVRILHLDRHKNTHSPTLAASATEVSV